MAKDSFIVKNTTKGPVTFELRAPVNEDSLTGLSSYHRRKIRRAGKRQLRLPSNLSVDLVEHTGMTVKQIKQDTELKKLGHAIKVLFDSETMTPPECLSPVYF